MGSRRFWCVAKVLEHLCMARTSIIVREFAGRSAAARNALRPRNHRDRGGCLPGPDAPCRGTSCRKAVALELERQHSFVGCARQQNPHGVGDRETHIFFQYRGGLVFYVCVDAGLDDRPDQSMILRGP